MKIVTKYKTNHNGTGQILAKGGGKQRTIGYDPALSSDRNHGSAAGSLALVLFQGEGSRQLAAKVAKHRPTDTGHEFSFDI